MLPRLTLDNSLLLILDIQTRLLPAMWEAERLERNVTILASAARQLEIPILVTEQNPTRIGTTTEPIATALGEFTPIDKMRFSALPDANDQLEATGRKTVILCGIEAHICVTQTALDLTQAGYTVFVVSDAISSRAQENRRVGWERMMGAGCHPTSTESAVFELLTTASSPHFKAILPLIK